MRWRDIALLLVASAGAPLAAAACGYDTLGDLGAYIPSETVDAAVDDGRDGGLDETSVPPDGTTNADATSNVEAGPGTSTTELRCGDKTCSIPGQTCCVDFSQGPPEEISFACVNGSDCPAPDSGSTAGQPGVALKCAGAANCQVGTACCITKIQTTIFARCTPLCGTGEAQLCEPNTSVSGCSNVSGSCSNANVDSWGLPSSYATCGGVIAQ